jgi:hypothetical protein
VLGHLAAAVIPDAAARAEDHPLGAARPAGFVVHGRSLTRAATAQTGEIARSRTVHGAQLCEMARSRR